MSDAGRTTSEPEPVDENAIPADPTTADLSPRDRVAQGLAGYRSPELLEKLLGEVMALEKVAWGSCKCGKRVQISVPDARAVTSSLVDLLKEGYGTPNARDTDRSIVVNRTVIVACDSGNECECACPDCLTQRTKVGGPNDNGNSKGDR